jgi:hypothetical protein
MQQKRVDEDKKLVKESDKINHKLLHRLSNKINENLKSIAKEKKLKDLDINHKLLLKEKNGYTM